MATYITAYTTTTTGSVIDSVVTVTTDAVSVNPTVLVYSNLTKVYSDLGVSQDLFLIVYLVLQKSSRPAPNQYVYSFNLRLSGRGTSLANLFSGPTGPTGFFATGPQGPTGPTALGPTGETGPQGIPGAGAGFDLEIATGESIVEGDPIAFNAAGKAQRADSTDSDRFPAIGIAASVSGTTVTVVSLGLADVYMDLTPNTDYFLVGDYIDDAPPSGPTHKGCQLLGRSLGTDTLLLNISANIIRFST